MNNGAKQVAVQGQIGKEIVPVGSGNVQQDQGTSGKEIVRAGAVIAQQIQTFNKFAALENDEGETDDNNQLALVNTNNP